MVQRNPNGNQHNSVFQIQESKRGLYNHSETTKIQLQITKSENVKETQIETKKTQQLKSTTKYKKAIN
jgi:hypothetical protein